MKMRSRKTGSNSSQLMLLVLIDLKPIFRVSFCPRNVLFARKSFGLSTRTTLSWSTLSTSKIRTSQRRISNSSKSSSHGSATTFTTYTIACVGHTLWLPAILDQSCISTDSNISRQRSNNSHKTMKCHCSQEASTRINLIQRIIENILARSAVQRTHLRLPMTRSSCNSRLMPTGRFLHLESLQLPVLQSMAAIKAGLVSRSITVINIKVRVQPDWIKWRRIWWREPWLLPKLEQKMEYCWSTIDQ